MTAKKPNNTRPWWADRGFWIALLLFAVVVLSLSGAKQLSVWLLVVLGVFILMIGEWRTAEGRIGVFIRRWKHVLAGLVLMIVLPWLAWLVTSWLKMAWE
jgi:hypothetical protein